MRCKTCDYPLWNLKARQCPECGSAFLPGEFDFVINTVRFCCPQCDQSYYGTGAKGHLVPQEFNCVACGIRISMNEMVLRPAEGMEERQTQVESMPWLERQRIGFIKALLQTVGRSMVGPNRLINATPPQAGAATAWWYAIVTLGIIFSIGWLVPLGVVSAVMAVSSSRDPTAPLIVGASVAAIATASILVFVGVWGLTAHGMLRITGGAEFSIARTYQALLYSCGTLAPFAVPVVGLYCGWVFVPIWWIVSACVMVAIGQRVHGGRATLAVLTMPVILGLITVASYVVLIAAIFSNQSRIAASQGGWALASAEVVVMTQAIMQHAAANGGNGPAHALELVGPGFGATNFVSSSSGTDETQIPIAGSTLDRFDFLPPGRQKQAAQAEGAAFPPGTIAHRLGDFVFTYHGINLNSPDPSLWVVVLSPSVSNPTFTGQQGIAVGLADGSTKVLRGSMQSELARQNALRAQYNLAPLPDPATVTHAKPAIAPVAGVGWVPDR